MFANLLLIGAELRALFCFAHYVPTVTPPLPPTFVLPDTPLHESAVPVPALVRRPRPQWAQSGSPLRVIPHAARTDSDISVTVVEEMDNAGVKPAAGESDTHHRSQWKDPFVDLPMLASPPSTSSSALANQEPRTPPPTNISQFFSALTPITPLSPDSAMIVAKQMQQSPVRFSHSNLSPSGHIFTLSLQFEYGDPCN